MKDNLKEELDAMIGAGKPIIDIIVSEQSDRERGRLARISKYVEAYRTMSEEAFRDIPKGENPWPDTPEELMALIDSLVNRQHDYGTCVYAMSHAALCAFNYVAGKLGVTGFQAGCADLDFVARRRWMEDGLTLLDHHDLLFPQLLEKFNRTALDYIMENLKPLQKRARELLEGKRGYESHPSVRAHWEWILGLGKVGVNGKE